MSRRGSDLLSVAPLTMVVLLLNIVLYAVCGALSKNMGQMDGAALYAMGASVREGLWEGQWIRLIAPSFLHANVLHILLNMMYLWRMGPSAEVHFGSANFGSIYLLAGVAGFCFSQIFGGVMSIGASCAVFGIVGAELAVKVLKAPALRHAWRSSEVRRTFYLALAYLGIGLLGILPIDNWGHLGGFLAGALLGFFFDLWRTRRQLGMGLVLAAVLAVAGLICAARWSVFNPYYHVHQALVAREEKAPESEAAAHLVAAREWARFWGREQRVEWIVQKAEAGEVTLDQLRLYGYVRVIAHFSGHARP